MTERFGSVGRFTVLMLVTVALGGCELIPSLAGSGHAMRVPGNTSLAVTVDAASGSIGGEALDASSLQATGTRSSDSIELDLTGANGLALTVLVPTLGGSADNPYGGDFGSGVDAGPPPPSPIDAGEGSGSLLDAGAATPPSVDAGEGPARVADAGTSGFFEDGGDGFGGGPGFPVDSGVHHGPGSNGRVSACSRTSPDCAITEDFELQIAQRAAGENGVVLDATWANGDRVHLEMHYLELR